MSEKNKISEEQLKGLQEKITVIQQLQTQIGGVESQKHVLLHQLFGAQDELQKLQTVLQDEYGKISVNIQDGTYEEITEEVVQEEA